MSDAAVCVKCGTSSVISKVNLLVSSCGHRMCEECIEMVIRENQNCPVCQSTLNRASFSKLTFSNPDVEKEVQIRRELCEIFNLRKENFRNDLSLFNDYLDAVECLVFYKMDRPIRKQFHNSPLYMRAIMEHEMNGIFQLFDPRGLHDFVPSSDNQKGHKNAEKAETDAQLAYQQHIRALNEMDWDDLLYLYKKKHNATISLNNSIRDSEAKVVQQHLLDEAARIAEWRKQEETIELNKRLHTEKTREKLLALVEQGSHLREAEDVLRKEAIEEELVSHSLQIESEEDSLRARQQKEAEMDKEAARERKRRRLGTAVLRNVKLFASHPPFVPRAEGKKLWDMVQGTSRREKEIYHRAWQFATAL
jgi:hypothetical protein